ncbi:MAG: cation transporter [bacterium]
MASGSGSLFSEAVHSFADTSNQALLMIGVKRSTKQATDAFSYGYKKERFLWALISACGIFFVGAGVTTYHGITSLITPGEIHISLWTFVILGISFVIESITLGIAIREIKKASTHKKRSLILEHGDPITLAVVYEDSIAVTGVLIAVIGLFCSYITKNPLRDSITSIIIGLLL